MRTVVRVGAIVLIALATSACIVRSSGPDENRAEVFEFLPVPAGRQETIAVLADVIGPGTSTLDETTVVPLGKYRTPAGPIVYAEFQVIDADLGRQQCSGHAGPTGGGWGCGPVGQHPPDDFQRPHITLSGSGSSGTWSDLVLTVGDDVTYLEAVAADGTIYHVEPIAGFAWMEWKSAHGDLVVTAFDADGRALGSVETDAA